jgi:hypothetical protein
MNLEKRNVQPDLPAKEHGESPSAEKEMAWRQKREETDRITDKLGLGIDEAIKEAVTAFRINEFSTRQSCSGHMADDEYKATSPWIDVCAPDPKGWRDSEGEKKKELERELTIENLKQQKRVVGLLDEYYLGREVSSDVKLDIERLGLFGGFRVQSTGADTISSLPPDEQINKLISYRKEMDDFAQFLKDRYFST